MGRRKKKRFEIWNLIHLKIETDSFEVWLVAVFMYIVLLSVQFVVPKQQMQLLSIPDSLMSYNPLTILNPFKTNASPTTFSIPSI